MHYWYHVGISFLNFSFVKKVERRKRSGHSKFVYQLQVLREKYRSKSVYLLARVECKIF